MLSKQGEKNLLPEERVVKEGRFGQLDAGGWKRTGGKV